MAIERHAQHRRKTRATMVCSRILIYVYAVWMGGAGGFGDGCQWLAGLVSIYAIWMGGAGGVGDGLPIVSRVSL